MQVICQKREKARDNCKLTYRFKFVSHQTDFQDVREKKYLPGEEGGTAVIGGGEDPERNEMNK